MAQHRSLPSLFLVTNNVRSKIVLALFAGIFVLTGFLVTPHAAKATSLSNPTWWKGTCDTNSTDALNISASGCVAGTWNDLQACYPTDSSHTFLKMYKDGNGVWHTLNQPNFNTYVPGQTGIANNAWQCVELSERYLNLEYGLGALGTVNGVSLDGSALADNYYNQYHSSIPSLQEGTLLSLNSQPTTGDVVSIRWSSRGPHTAIVTGTSISAAGNGTISLFQQNAFGFNGNLGPSPNGYLNVTGWQAQDASSQKYPRQKFDWLHYNISPHLQHNSPHQLQSMIPSTMRPSLRHVALITRCTLPRKMAPNRIMGATGCLAGAPLLVEPSLQALRVSIGLPEATLR